MNSMKTNSSKKEYDINILKDKYNKYKIKYQKNQLKIDNQNEFINKNRDKIDNYDELKEKLSEKEV
jgi:hypothetical protein